MFRRHSELIRSIWAPETADDIILSEDLEIFERMEVIEKHDTFLG